MSEREAERDGPVPESSGVTRALEAILFASRWLLAPFYLLLVLALAGLLIKALQEAFHFLSHVFTATEAEVILGVLALIDLTFTGSLIVIVIFSGYENFVSKIDASAHRDWPDWMSKIDFSGLKLKLISSIVAISAIQVLKAFMNVKGTSDRDLMWYVAIHLVFVGSGLVMALSDRISGDAHAKAGNGNGH
ncbi:TIGR00645 family protein [Bosea sp. (in: a-proteobacteria)]|uniref:TIGR00645 family protein n=1 Tax=Bosea sp. (in: a-proteobacteria) TaxID=1871050 RepID=UPI003F7079CF